ncbi:hypothetical protein EON79_07890 [bacterium]|nr:MAG: hypothetical protein EON79_07890 [bacterium]
MALLNRYGEAKGGKKLSDVLSDQTEHSFSSLASFEANIEAVDACLGFAIGLKKPEVGGSAQVVVVGPSGWGKSHLLDAVTHDLGKATDPIHVERANVGEAPSNIDVAAPLLLEDVQESLGRPRLRQILQVGLERRVRAGRPTILAFTLPKPTRTLRAFLPFPRAWEIVEMGEPVGEEREKLLLQMGESEGLALSPALGRILARHMHGNGRTLSGALKRLRLSGSEWLDNPSTLRAVGLLDPFFADNSAWDLKDRVLKAAEEAHPRFGRVVASDLALYTLLHEARLNELDVARAARTAPADAYQRAARFRARIESDPGASAYVRQFIDVVVDGLQRED